MKNVIFAAALISACCLLAHSCQKPQEEPKTYDTPLGDVPAVRVVHNGDSFAAPEVAFEGYAPVVIWGDGRSESYCEGLEHQYASSGEYTVTVCSENIASFSLTDLSGVISVETLNFGEEAK